MSTPRKRRGSCVHTYAYVLRQLREWEAINPNATPEDTTRALADICRSTIERNLHRCLSEAARSGDGARRRYAWDTGNGVIYLWVPRWVPIRRLLDVLRRELPDGVPGRADDAERVQAIVDDWFPVRWVTFDMNCGIARVDTDPVGNAMRNEIRACALVPVVATGMAASIGRQRPSIRRLGPERLQQMVTRILEDQISGTYCPSAVAEAYGLLRSNLSHFAPKRWRQGGKIPDLWAYVIEVASRFPALVGVLQDATPAHVAGAEPLRGNTTGVAANAEDLDPGMVEKVTVLLDRISAKSIGAHVDKPISLTPLDQFDRKPSHDSNEGFVDAISRRYAALLQSLGSPTVSPDTPAVREDAVALVERTFQWDGGYSGALAEAKDRGVSHVLKAMTERFIQEARLRYAHRVFKETLAPLAFQDRVALVKAFVAKAGPSLPPEIRSQQPERLVSHCEALLEAYVRSMDKVKGLLRTL